MKLTLQMLGKVDGTHLSNIIKISSFKHEILVFCLSSHFLEVVEAHLDLGRDELGHEVALVAQAHDEGEEEPRPQQQSKRPHLEGRYVVWQPYATSDIDNKLLMSFFLSKLFLLLLLLLQMT